MRPKGKIDIKMSIKGRFLYLLLPLFFSGCFFGVESTQEPRNNPLDPLYHSVEGRMILSVPEKNSSGDVRIYYRLRNDSLVSSYTTAVAYSFTDTQLENVITTLNKGKDPISYLTAVSPAPVFDFEKDYEKRYIDISVSSGTYIVVRFVNSGSNEVNYSNIVLYKTN